MREIVSFTGEFHFLSNFFPHRIEYEGIVYPSSEHAYQAAKTLDPELRQKIAEMKTPAKAKRGGKILPLRPDWEQKKFKIMYEICSIKFRDADLREKLKRTRPAELIEGNTWHDNIWGVCTCRKCPGAGRNLLGKVLMEIRNNIILTDLWNDPDHLKELADLQRLR